MAKPPKSFYKMLFSFCCVGSDWLKSLLPILAISYMMQYLDKSAMGYTAILGLRTDLHLVGQDYSWASSLFYFGYLAGSPLAAMLIVRLPIGKFTSSSMYGPSILFHTKYQLLIDWMQRSVGCHSHVDGTVQECVWSLGCSLLPRFRRGRACARHGRHHLNVVQAVRAASAPICLVHGQRDRRTIRGCPIIRYRPYRHYCALEGLS